MTDWPLLAVLVSEVCNHQMSEDSDDRITITSWSDKERVDITIKVWRVAE